MCLDRCFLNTCERVPRLVLIRIGLVIVSLWFCRGEGRICRVMAFIVLIEHGRVGNFRLSMLKLCQVVKLVDGMIF